MADNPNSRTFEEIMFSVIEATQDTFNAYLQTDVFSGQAKKKLEPIDADVVGIVGIGGKRVGYIILAMDLNTAKVVTEKLSMMEDPDKDTIFDTVGELINIIAGSIKSKYHKEYGNVDLGLPMIMSGKLSPKEAGGGSLSVASDSVIIPFKSFEDNVNFTVMVFM